MSPLYAPPDIITCTIATRPTAPKVGQFIWETDTERLLYWDGTSWSQYRIGNEPDKFYYFSLANGTATAYADFYTQNTVLAANVIPYPYTMVVEAHINSGGNGGVNEVAVQIRDQAGARLGAAKTVIDIDWRVKNNVTSQQHVWTPIAYGDYAANATCGFRLAYLVTTSNIYIDGFARVSFVQRP